MYYVLDGLAVFVAARSPTGSKCAAQYSWAYAAYYTLLPVQEQYGHIQPEEMALGLLIRHGRILRIVQDYLAIIVTVYLR